MRLSVLCLLLWLGACATAPAGDELAAYPAALAGAYDNAAQYAAAPADLKHPPAGPADEWIDRQSATITPVTAPTLGPYAVLVDWRGDGGAARQRLWAFRREAGEVRLDIYDLAPGRAPVGAGAGLTGADLKGYGPACALHVRPRGPGAWDAQIAPDECRTTGADGQPIGLSIRITAMPTGLLYEEAGVRDDGAYAYRIPGAIPYEFRRTP